jgi:uncharacterized protein (TIGR02453 family)
MSAESEFLGFSKQTVAFLRGLKKNNSWEWFEVHREIYEEHVLGPAKAFVVALGARLKEISPNIVAVPRINKSIFRLNRDTRFSLDKSPYKPNLGIYFWEGPRPRMESPGFYFHLEPPTFLLGAGYYIFPDWLIDRFRRAVVQPEEGRRLAAILKEIARSSGFEVGGKYFKRVPSGYDTAHPNAPLLQHNGLHAVWETTIPNEMFTPSLVDYCWRKFKPLAPLHHWLSALAAGALTGPARLNR